MTEAAPTLDPFPRDAIEKNRRLTREVDGFDEIPPNLWETFCLKDSVKRVPADRIKGFTKVQFEDSSRHSTFVARLDDVHSIVEVLRNGASRN